jgi:hypothetical protein
MPRTAEGERTGVDVPPMPSGFKLSREKLLRIILKLMKLLQMKYAWIKNARRTLTMIKDRRRDPELYDEAIRKIWSTR